MHLQDPYKISNICSKYKLLFFFTFNLCKCNFIDNFVQEDQGRNKVIDHVAH